MNELRAAQSKGNSQLGGVASGTVTLALTHKSTLLNSEESHFESYTHLKAPFLTESYFHIHSGTLTHTLMLSVRSHRHTHTHTHI
jgi:hypothetical protein